MIDLRCGDYRETLADVTCDALICDPPYSERTHKGQRTGSSIRKPTIAYATIDREWCLRLARLWAPRVRNWVVIFCDHRAFNWHEEAWESEDWVTFAPVFVKENPPPRFSGDGPALGLEFMLVARPRRSDVRPRGSLPSRYTADCGHDRSAETAKEMGSIAGRKPLGMMREVVRDYTLPGDTVVDVCSGSGTTLIAAAIEGRKAIGSELDPETYAKALNRIATSGEIERYAPSDALKHAKQTRLF